MAATQRRRRPARAGGDRESTYFHHAAQVAAWLKANNFRYDCDRKRWYQLGSNGVWREDRHNSADASALTLAGGFDPQDKGSLASYCLRFAASELDIATLADEWDRHPGCIGTPSRCIDLDWCGAAGAHEVEASKIWGADRGSLSYDRAADLLITKSTGVGVGGLMDVWDKFILEACGGDTELRDFLQRWAGYALSGHTSEHCVLFVYGPAGTGKSRFVEALQHVWGDYAVTMPMDALMAGRGDRHPAELAMLKGVRLAVAVETEEGKRWDAAKIKTLTGGDTIAARFMRENWFRFQPTHKLLVVGNHAPQLSVVDDAMKRRLLVVPFTNKPAVPDPDLPRKLQQAGGEILLWAIEGYGKWKQRGLAPPRSVLDATARYFEDEDSVGEWLRERTEAVPGCFASAAELYRSWSAWCMENGQQPKGVKRLLEDLLRRPGIERWRTKTARGVMGVRIGGMDQLPIGVGDDD